MSRNPDQSHANGAMELEFAPAKRKRLRWSLRAIFLVTTLTAAVLAVRVNHDRRPRARAVAKLRARGAHVLYDYQLAADGPFRGVAQFVGEDYFGTIDSVRIDREGITDEEIALLLQFPRLRRLWLDHSGTEDDDLAIVGQLTKLEELSIWHNSVTDDGLEHLLMLSSLTSLTMNETLVTDRGLQALSVLPNLKYVGALFTDVTQEGVDEFVRAGPSRRVQLSESPPAFTARIRMPDGKLVNSFDGPFRLSVACTNETGGSFTNTTSGGKLGAVHLRWHTLSPNGKLKITLQLNEKLTATATAAVVDNKVQPSTIELQVSRPD